MKKVIALNRLGILGKKEGNNGFEVRTFYYRRLCSFLYPGLENYEGYDLSVLTSERRFVKRRCKKQTEHFIIITVGAFHSWSFGFFVLSVSLYSLNFIFLHCGLVLIYTPMLLFHARTVQEGEKIRQACYGQYCTK